MKQRLLLAALAALALTAPAAAEPMRMAQAGAPDLLPPYEVITIVRSTGFDPLGKPIRRGPNYVLRAVDEYDREVDVVVGAHSGEVISVRPVNAATARLPASPPRGAVTMGPYERMPPDYVPPPGQRGYTDPRGYSAGPPVYDEDDDEASLEAPRPPAPVTGALPRPGYAARPPVTGAVPPASSAMRPGAPGAPPPSEPRVITSTEPDHDGIQSGERGLLPPPPERFPQRAAAPAVKPKPPMKKAAAAPKQAPLPKPKPQSTAEAPPPPPPAAAAPPPAAPAPVEKKPSADPVPN